MFLTIPSPTTNQISWSFQNPIFLASDHMAEEYKKLPFDCFQLVIYFAHGKHVFDQSLDLLHNFLYHYHNDKNKTTWMNHPVDPTKLMSNTNNLNIKVLEEAARCMHVLKCFEKVSNPTPTEDKITLVIKLDKKLKVLI